MQYSINEVSRVYAGFCYVVFEDPRSVATLVQLLQPDKRGELYVKVRSRQKPCGKATQIIPWLIADSHWARDAYAELPEVAALSLEHNAYLRTIQFVNARNKLRIISNWILKESETEIAYFT